MKEDVFHTVSLTEPSEEESGFVIVPSDEEAWQEFKHKEPTLYNTMLNADPHSAFKMISKIPNFKDLENNEALWKEKYMKDYANFAWKDNKLFQSYKEAYERHALSCCLILAGNVNNPNGTLSFNYRSSDRIVQVSCGGERTAYITAKKELFLLGFHSDNLTPRKKGRAVTTDAVQVKLTPPQPIVQVSCGTEHTGFVTENGELYTFGNSNTEGQLAHGDQKVYRTPIKVDTFGRQVSQVSCGGSITAYITTLKELYVCCNYLNTTADAPEKVADNVEQVDCGDFHLGYVTTDGSLYVLGSNGSQQLGIKTKTPDIFGEPVRVESEYYKDFKKNIWLSRDTYESTSYYGKVVKVSCGYRNTAFVTSDKKMYIMGYMPTGITFGLEDDFIKALRGLNRIPYPKEVPLNGVIDVSVGRDHIAMVTDTGKVYTVGYCSVDAKTTPNNCVMEWNSQSKPIKIEGIDKALSVDCGRYFTAVLCMKANNPIKVQKPGFFSSLVGW